MRVELSPAAAVTGDDVVIRVPESADPRPQAVIVGITDDVTTGWLAEVSLGSGEDGTAKFSLGLDHQAVAFVTGVRLPDGGVAPADSNPIAINPAQADIDAESLRVQLAEAQSARFAQALGDPTAEAVIEHRVLCVIERLLITTPLRLPGVTIEPIAARPDGRMELCLLNGIIRDLDWGDDLPEDFWIEQTQANRPWTAIVCRQVWAPDFDTADQLAWEQRNRLLAVFGLARGARGRPVATVVQQRQPDDSIKFRLFAEDEPYTGNLIGGFISGENPRELLIQAAGMQQDPLLEVLVDLYSEALADASVDARYLRWWSILETLSDARISRDQPVVLLDGEPYPDGGHTGQAGPRVYELIKETLRIRSTNEDSLVSPAADLYEATRAWYARRNATGHYGRFDPSDSRQQAQAWMQWAELTQHAEGPNDAWLRALQRIVEMALHRELRAAGEPHV